MTSAAARTISTMCRARQCHFRCSGIRQTGLDPLVAANGAPQKMQNLVPGTFGDPHDGQPSRAVVATGGTSTAAPQVAQKRSPAAGTVPQIVHGIPLNVASSLVRRGWFRAPTSGRAPYVMPLLAAGHKLTGSIPARMVKMPAHWAGRGHSFRNAHVGTTATALSREPSVVATVVKACSTQD